MPCLPGRSPAPGVPAAPAAPELFSSSQPASTPQAGLPDAVPDNHTAPPGSGRDAGSWAMPLPGARGLQPPSPAPGRRWCNGFPPRRGPLSPHMQGTGAQRPTVDSCPPRQGTQPLNLPIATRPSEKGPCPSRHRGGGWSPPSRREPEGQWGDGRGEELWGGGATGPVCVCLCVLHTHPRAWCACQVCACPPRVPTQRVHVSVGARPCTRPAAQLAVHSWTRGAVRTARCEVAGV